MDLCWELRIPIFSSVFECAGVTFPPNTSLQNPDIKWWEFFVSICIKSGKKYFPHSKMLQDKFFLCLRCVIQHFYSVPYDKTNVIMNWLVLFNLQHFLNLAVLLTICAQFVYSEDVSVYKGFNTTLTCNISTTSLLTWEYTDLNNQHSVIAVGK